MKQYWIQLVDNKTRFDLRAVPIPSPGPTQVLMRVRATSFNYGDIFARIARHRADVARPAGVDAAGEVVAVGERATEVRVGERIMARVRGGFAQYALVELAQVIPVPDHLDWHQAAAIPIVFITAYEALFQLGELAAGETVLVAGASSGVGVACIQAAKCAGARVIGTSGSAEKLERLRTLGMDEGIHARAGDYSAAVLSANGGQGVQLAIDLVGGSAFPACQRSLGDFGRLGVVGYVDGQMRSEIDIESLHGKRLRIYGVSNTPLDPAQRTRAKQGFVQTVLPHIQSGRIVPVVDRVFGFDQVEAAMAYVETNVLLGKVIVSLD